MRGDEEYGASGVGGTALIHTKVSAAVAVTALAPLVQMSTQ